MIKYLLAFLCTCFASLTLAATTATLPTKNLLLNTKIHWHLGSTAETIKITNGTGAAFNVVVAVDYFVTAAATSPSDSVVISCSGGPNYSIVRGSSFICLVNPASALIINPGTFVYGSSGTYVILT